MGVWILCLYLMGLNLSNQQIAQELELNKDDSQQMTSQLRAGIVKKKPEVILEKEVEMDKKEFEKLYAEKQAEEQAAKEAEAALKVIEENQSNE